jgi:AhpD family alkylhydroperoxidase
VPRIDGVSDTRAGPSVRLVYYFTRRGLSRLSGRAPAGIIDPLRMYAHVPGLLRGYAGLERATARLDRLDPRLRALAELKAAMLVACEYCVDLGSTVARRWGLTDDELAALPAYADSPLFSELDKGVLDYATGMCHTPAHVSDELFAALRAHLTDVQLVELTHVIALENLRARFNIGLGVGAAGFCVIPEES